MRKKNWEQLASIPDSPDLQETEKKKNIQRTLAVLLSGIVSVGAWFGYKEITHTVEKNEEHTEFTDLQKDLRKLFSDENYVMSTGELLDQYLLIQEEILDLTPDQVHQLQVKFRERINKYREKIKDGVGQYEMATIVLGDIDDMYDQWAENLSLALEDDNPRVNCESTVQYLTAILPHVYDPDEIDLRLQYFSPQGGVDGVGHIRVLGNLNDTPYILEGSSPIPVDYQRDIKGTYLVTADSSVRAYAKVEPKILMTPTIEEKPTTEQSGDKLEENQSDSNNFAFPDNMKTRPYVLGEQNNSENEDALYKVRESMITEVEKILQTEGRLSVQPGISQAEFNILIERYKDSRDIPEWLFYNTLDMLVQALPHIERNESIKNVVIINDSEHIDQDIVQRLYEAGVSIIHINMKEKKASKLYADSDGNAVVEQLKLNLSVPNRVSWGE